jgi:hypothetical protein
MCLSGDAADGRAAAAMFERVSWYANAVINTESGGGHEVSLFHTRDSITNEEFTFLTVFTFDSVLGFYYGDIPLTADQFTISREGVSVTGPIYMTLTGFNDPCQKGDPLPLNVTVGDLVWQAFGPPTSGHFNSRVRGEYFSSGRISQREAQASGLITGDIEFDLADAVFARVGSQRFRSGPG